MCEGKAEQLWVCEEIMCEDLDREESDSQR